jgi:HEPN domain-containing protein
LCFHAQQAAEKSLKAVLIGRGIAPPRSHNIRTLLDLLEADILIPDTLSEAAALTDYAVMSRYPIGSEPVGVEDWREAVRLAEYAMIWAEEQLNLTNSR